MSRATAPMRSFAKRIIAFEIGEAKSFGPKAVAAFQVSERLRPYLATLMGNAGFRSLLARSLALASAEVPWLRALHVRADGSLEGVAELETQVRPEEIAEGGVVLMAQLLGLLVAFIGEKLTLSLVRQTWPKLDPGSFESGNGAGK